MSTPHTAANSDARKRAAREVQPDGDVVALALVLDRHVTDAAFESGCRLSCGYDGDDLTRHMAEAVLASDWLAAHDAQVRREAEAALADLRAAVEALAAQANDEAQTHWYRHNEAADDGDLDRANREGEVAEVFDQTRSALRALLAQQHDGSDSDV